MAKNEIKNEADTDKRKAKKRKQANATDDAHEEKVFLEQTSKASKRKSQPSNVSPKKSKSHQRTADDGAKSDEEIHEPTAQELKESEKPENKVNIETIRKKKQKSHKKNLQVKQDHAVVKDSERNEEYLMRWKNSRDEWKFVKLRQVSIQNSMLDITKIGDEVFPIALEYMAGAKGAARRAMQKTAEDEIEKLDAEFKKTPTLKEDSVKMSRYKRARELLQAH